MKKKVLLTGFEPFKEVAENPSELVARGIGEMDLDRYDVRVAVLPVEFVAARQRIASLVRDKNWRPDVVLCMGVAASREWISVERVAVNIMDSAAGDNAGFCPDELPVVKDAPLARRATLPVKSIVQALTAHGLPAKVSNTAGTYVCNTVMYAALNACSRLNIPCGFIHLPPLEVVDAARQQQAVLIALNTLTP